MFVLACCLKWVYICLSLEIQPTAKFANPWYEAEEILTDFFVSELGSESETTEEEDPFEHNWCCLQKELQTTQPKRSLNFVLVNGWRTQANQGGFESGMKVVLCHPGPFSFQQQSLQSFREHAFACLPKARGGNN